MWRLLSIAIAAGGCNSWFGIDSIPYAGPADAASSTDSRDGAVTDAGPLMLKIDLKGSGIGSVTDDQGLIACGNGGSMCTATYPPNTTVTLVPTATADGVSEFNLWGDACLRQNTNDGTPWFPNCVLAVGGNVTVSADFETGEVVNLIPDSPASDPGAVITDTDGQHCDSGSTCTFLFGGLQPVMDQLTATQDSCAMFKSFRGGNCPDANTSCTVTFNMNGFGNVITVNYDYIAGSGTGCTQ